MFGDSISYFTHISTLSTLACSMVLASRPTHTRNMDVSPWRTDFNRVVPEPNCLRMGRALRQISFPVVISDKKEKGVPLEQIQVRVQASSNALKQQNRNHHVHEVTLQTNVMLPHHLEDLAQDVADLNATQRKRARFHAKDEMLHLQCKKLGVQYGVWLPGSFDHQMACAIPVEFRNRAEEVQEIAAILVVQLRYKTSVKEEKLGSKTFRFNLL